MKRICDLCWKEWDAHYHTFDPSFMPVYWDNLIAIKKRSKDKIAINNMKTCPGCTRDIWEYIESKQWTVCGTKWNCCDFCKFDKLVKSCTVKTCMFTLRRPMNARVHQIFLTITNRLRARCSIMEEWVKHEPRFRYMMLSRMKQDCDYYLGNGNRSTNHLWAGGEREQIEHMKAIWNTFPEEDKPEWLTWDEILDYERNMIE